MENLALDIYDTNNFSLQLLAHNFRVANTSKRIAYFMGLSSNDMDNLYDLSFLHDIGKSLIPQAIVNKPGKLTDREWIIMKKHSIYSEKLYISNNFPIHKKEKRSIIENGQILRAHHEKYDGSGYPDKLSGEDIPLLSRIITIADYFDAITTPRVYRKHKLDNAIEILDSEAGKTFDPHIYTKYGRPILISML